MKKKNNVRSTEEDKNSEVNSTSYPTPSPIPHNSEITKEALKMKMGKRSAEDKKSEVNSRSYTSPTPSSLVMHLIL